MERPDTSSQRGAAPAARRSSRAITSGLVLDIGDLPVAVTASSAAWATVAGELFGTLPERADPPAVELVLGGDAGDHPSRRPDGSYAGVDVWTDGDLLTVDHRAGFRARATATTTSIAGAVAAAGDAAVEAVRALRQLVTVGLTHTLAHHDRYLLHAGAVTRSGQTLLLLGSTGQGKSTLAYAALGSGWDVLSDDTVVLRPAGDRWEARGLPRPFTVPSDVLPESSVAPTGSPVRSRVVVQAPLSEGWAQASGSVIVGHSPAEAGELRAVSGPPVLRAFIGAFLSADNPPLLRRFLPVGAALSRLPCWELGHSCRPEGRLADAAGLLDVAAPGPGASVPP